MNNVFKFQQPPKFNAPKRKAPPKRRAPLGAIVGMAIILAVILVHEYDPGLTWVMGLFGK